MPAFPPGRYAGREPKRASASSSIGVAVRKSGTARRRSCTSSRYTRERRARARSRHRLAELAHLRRRRVAPVQRLNSCISAPASVTSSVRSATGSRPNCCEMISPCSVILMRPLTVPGRERGERAIHRRAAAASDAAPSAVEEPERDARSANSVASASCASYSAHDDGEDAGVLPRIGVADHHLLPVAARARAAGGRRIVGSSARMTSGACSRSSSVSNSGTTSSRDLGGSAARSTSPASRAEQQHAEQVVGARSSSRRCTCSPPPRSSASCDGRKVSSTRVASASEVRLTSGRAGARGAALAVDRSRLRDVARRGAMSAWSRTSIRKPWNPCARTRCEQRIDRRAARLRRAGARRGSRARAAGRARAPPRRRTRPARRRAARRRARR